jgi:hypothetical protein
MDLSERVRALAARLSVLEKSHRALHRELHVTDRLAVNSASETRARWRRTKKSK